MDYNRIHVRRVVKEDRLSNLPDDLLYKIMSCFDTKLSVQTCLLSSRWKLLWTSMPFLNFSADQFGDFHKFDKFVSHVLTHRNHQKEMSSVNLDFHGSDSHGLVQKIANYAFSHNVQDLTVNILIPRDHVYPPWLFSSQSLKQCTLSCQYMHLWDTSETPLDFPALTTLILSHIELWRGDIFSKCVNLKNLTVKHFIVGGLEEAFDIITPRLSNLMLIQGGSLKTINVIAPKLENLTIINCAINYLNASPGVSSLCYTSWSWIPHVQFLNEEFHCLNKVTISSSVYDQWTKFEEDALHTINMLRKLNSARCLTLDADIVECISSFPDLLSQHSSPFTNLIYLTLDYSKRKYVSEFLMSDQARKFLLENSPSATLVMKLPNQGSK